MPKTFGNLNTKLKKSSQKPLKDLRRVRIESGNS